MAAEGRGTDAGGRRPRAAARQCAILLIAVISAIVHHADAGFYSLPHVDDGADWTYRVRGDVHWLAPGLASAAHTGIGRPYTVSPWLRPVNAGYPRRRRRTELDPDGRFVDRSASKRRFMGLDNLDYATSLLDTQRLRQSRLNAGAGGKSTHDDNGHERVVSASGGSMSGRRRGGRPAYGRYSMKVSPEKLRKMAELQLIGRR